MRLIALLLTLCATTAHSETWIQVTGTDVENLLNDTSWSYSNASQTFYKSGVTEYNAGRPSIGNWRGQGDQYCSEWPPNAGWDCYDLFLDVDSGAIKFVGARGDETIGTPKN